MCNRISGRERIRQDKRTGEDQTRPDQTRQDKTRRQERTRQAKTREDKRTSGHQDTRTRRQADKRTREDKRTGGQKDTRKQEQQTRQAKTRTNSRTRRAPAQAVERSWSASAKRLTFRVSCEAEAHAASAPRIACAHAPNSTWRNAHQKQRPPEAW
eukprot:397341-Rhodomonas_salina.1